MHHLDANLPGIHNVSKFSKFCLAEGNATNNASMHESKTLGSLASLFSNHGSEALMYMYGARELDHPA